MFFSTHQKAMCPKKDSAKSLEMCYNNIWFNIIKGVVADEYATVCLNKPANFIKTRNPKTAYKSVIVSSKAIILLLKKQKIDT